MREDDKNIFKEDGLDIESPGYFVKDCDKTFFREKIKLSSADKKTNAYLCSDGNRKVLN
jgi:hypothetical protein